MVNLREERKKAGMTQAELGNKIGTVRQTISNIENGISRPSIETAQAIAKVLGFDWARFYQSP